jgi:hypothetical protein
MRRASADRLIRSYRWALCVLGLTLLTAACAGQAGFLGGSGTVNVRWNRLGGAPGTEQPFTGTISGQPLHGSAVIPQPISVFILGEWTGTFENKTFALRVSVSLPHGLKSLASLTLAITGTYGTWKVKATAKEVGNSNEVSFAGTVGPYHVSGVVAPVIERHSTASVTARFAVSS